MHVDVDGHSHFALLEASRAVLEDKVFVIQLNRVGCLDHLVVISLLEVWAVVNGPGVDEDCFVEVHSVIPNALKVGFSTVDEGQFVQAVTESIVPGYHFSHCGLLHERHEVFH